MNGTSTNKSTINIIIIALVTIAVMCVITICIMSYQGLKIPPELNTLSGGLVGTLSAMLVKTSPTETTKQVAVQDQPVVVPADNSKVIP